MRRLVVVGDALLDRDVEGSVERICPDAPVPVVDERWSVSRPGGAALAAALAASDGRPVTLVTAVGDDVAGRQLRCHLADRGVEVVDLRLTGATPEKIRLRADGQSLMRLDRGGPPGAVDPPLPEAAAALAGAGAVLVADYGRGVAAAMAADVASAARAVVWDPHPRGATPIPGARLVTPNRSELMRAADARGTDGRAGHRTGGGAADLARVTVAARRLRRHWRVSGLAVTLGPQGALLVEGEGAPLVAPAPPVARQDACGAGDRFASAAAGLLADGALPSEAVVGAVQEASAFVAAGGAAGVGRPDEAMTGPADDGRGRPTAGVAHRAGAGAGAIELARRVRSAGGTVVATGGCFDLLHAGHVSLLAAARSLGDCLIVCLNSDASVGRLKGPGRPVAPEADRRSVLLALGSVDEVLVFDEETPNRALEQLRPHLFAKGGDYAGADLPEAATVAGWDGQVVVLPYLDGRSTSSLLAASSGPTGRGDGRR